ncbi:hypothetical protein FF38_01596 [Lucilia cuprina]|uniref:DUF7027 domain-containing protein n=1 Tax=Lucilia cuprina TaxID=7375 RepID=A0A0L0CEM6_LUCCU|nr:hypothetical protein CVS40_2985 [Lucilia cuprina]KNC30858.1 hypothetical protein FF38_01596 [Lucilia cuprina]
MKCWSRSTLGVVIGSINVLAYIICTVYIIDVLVDINRKQERTQQQNDVLALYNTIFVVLIVVCLILLLISSLMIMGIIKRRHKLMLPWLIITGISFVVNCARFVYHLILAIIAGIPLTTVLVVFIVGLVATAFAVLLLWPIYTLYGDIRKESNLKPGRVMQKTDKKFDYKPQPSYDI